jgi:enoyl-CoA hydratase/carnithine racemase
MSGVRVDQLGPVCVITLDRPHRLNAFTAASYAALADALRRADGDPGVDVLLIEGAGRAFSSGVDLDELASGDRQAFADTFGDLLVALTELTKPLIAGVHGAAVGFGATLLLHCDIVVVADDARIRFPFTALGTAPEAGSSWLLPRRIGAQRAADLILTSRWVSGAEAVELGLASRAVPVDEVPDVTRQVAAQVAGHPVAAQVAAKRLLREGVAAATVQAIEREAAAGAALAAELGGLADPRLRF